MNGDASLLGIQGYLDERRVSELLEALRQTWSTTVGRPPRDLEEDLKELRRWFDPVAQGQRLRRELAELAPLPQDLLDPGPPLTLTVGPGKRLLTPEGRCALELLDRLPSDLPGYVIGDTELLPYERRLGLLYRDWSRHRLKSVIDLLAGTTNPLQIPAAGVVIALLVNRCTNEDRALTRFASGAERDAVDRAFFAPVQAFGDILAPSRRRNRGNPRLVSGWMLYEARRRLGEALVVVDARGGQNGRVWIRGAMVDDVIEVIARDLVRGHRARATRDRFLEAYDALVQALRGQLPNLAGFRLSHERPLDTARLRERLADRLSLYISSTQ